MIEQVMAEAAADSMVRLVKEELLPGMQVILSRHPEPVSVSVADGAAMIGISDTSLRILIADGEVESFRLGRRRLVTVTEIRRFVNSKSEQPT